MSINVETLSAAKAYTDQKTGKKGIALPEDSNGEADYGTEGQFAVSDGAGGVTWVTVSNANDKKY